VDTEQFIASLVSSLAWPVAVVGTAIAFRRQIGQLLTTGPLKRLKMGSVEAEFERRTAEVETKLAVPPEVAVTERVAGATVVEELAPVADVSPSSAVLEAFERVQQDIRARLEAAGFSRADQPWGVVGLAQRAKAGGLITPQSLEAVEGVAVMRNLAAHRPDDVSREAALEYLALIDGVLFTLRSGGKD
jgi:hypothetical protein